MPVAFGVLTCERASRPRSGRAAAGNKGAEAVRTALEMADVFARLRSAASTAQPGSPLHSPAMSKICAICGKAPSFGHNRSHSMVATKRRFNPNLQRVRILVNGVARRSYVCTRCLKAGRVQKAV